MKSIKLILVPLLMVCLAVGAQPFRVSRLSAERGLSSCFVTSIAADKEGVLWVATEEGLNRFNGSGFYTYFKDRGMRQTITGNELNCLLDDPQAPVLWIGTQRNGLNAYYYEEDCFERYQHDAADPRSIATNDITCLRPAADGRVWVCTYWEGVDRLNCADGTFEHFNTSNVSGLPSNQTWCAVDDGQGHLYVGHVNAGLSVIDMQRRTARTYRHDPSDAASLACDSVHSVCCDRSGRIWVGTDVGLDLLDVATGRFTHFTDGGRLSVRVFDIREGSDGFLWVATEERGVAQLDLSSLSQPVFRYVVGGDSDVSLSGNSVRCLFEDSYGNFWVGLYGAGVNFLTRHTPLFGQLRYNPLNPRHSLTTRVVLAVCQDRRGRLWVGTDMGGVGLFDASHVSIGQQLGNRSVQAALCDSQGNVWLGCFNDNAYVAPADGGSLRPLMAGPPEDVRSFYEAPDGQMWICTSNGLYTADVTTRQLTRHYAMEHPLTRSVLIDGQGRRWVGTFGNGLEVFSSDMQLLRAYNTDGGFPSNTINQLLAGRDGRVWVATSEGLVSFASPADTVWTVYSWNSGLNNIHIRAVNEDGEGNVWVSTNQGISCLRRGADTFSNYVHQDHVPAGNFSIGCTATAGRMLCFGSTEGLSYFDPVMVLAQKAAPDVFIASARIWQGQRDSIVCLRRDDRLSLSYDASTFSVLLGVADYALADEAEFSYFMEGRSADWVAVEGNAITFHNLSPGTYCLQVRSRLRNQPWGTDVATLTVHVAPPLWRTWWAYLLYVLLFAALCYYAWRSYLNHVHLRNLQEQWQLLSQKLGAQNEQLEQKRGVLQASLNELDQQFLNRVNQLVEQRIASDKIDIGYLAEGMNVSQSTLYRKMKSLTGISTNEYVRKYKMHYAERLLLEGRHTVTEVAYMVGMSTPGYFRKCFKEEFGATPSDYLRRVKG